MVENTLALQKEMCRLDAIIGEKYLGRSPVPEDSLHIAYRFWLENDISSALLDAEDPDTVFDEICNILKTSWAYDEINKLISLRKAYKRAEIRRDFATALKNVKNGAALSGILDYSFSNKDLYNLAKLHKANRFRRKIEELLTDCNFHSECSLMSSKNYSNWLS